MSTKIKDMPGELVVMNLIGDSDAQQHVIQYLSYDTDYLVIPGCPKTREELKASGYTDKQIEYAWLSFKKYAKKCILGETTRFSRDQMMRYNIRNGLIAIYTEVEVKVAKPSGILIDNLASLGFKQDNNLFVPFSDREAYYDKDTDILFTIW